ncbi:MAG: MFS transporter, partial [Actinomycetota bacterium]|nr:MFS transporter [Actinomycetota bacterium]
PQAMLGLSLVLLLTGNSLTFAAAGSVAGVFALSQAAAAPIVARFVDRFGQRRVVLPLLVVHETALVVVLITASRHASLVAIAAAAAVAGLCLPQVGSLTRARWTHLLRDDTRDRMGTALALESLVEEAAFVLSPVLVASLVASAGPSWGVIVSGGIGLMATTALLVQSSTAPPGFRPDRSVGRSAMRSGGFGAVVALFFAIGTMFGLIEVGVVAVAKSQHETVGAGILLGVWALGSVMSGVVFGAVRWRVSVRRRLLIGSVGIALGACLTALASGSLATLGVALFIAGLANSPTLISGNALVPALVSSRSRTEAFTWLSVIIFAGIAVGSPVAGVLSDRLGPPAALAAAAGAGLLVACLGIASQRLIRNSSARETE